MKKINSLVWSAVLIIGFISYANYMESNNVKLKPVEKWDAPKEANDLKNLFANNAESVVAGKKIYEKTCWVCHGLSGKGDGPAGIALKPKAADHTSALVQNQTDGSIYWKVTKGRGAMPSYEASLSQKERWAIVNYIRKLAVQKVTTK